MSSAARPARMNELITEPAVEDALSASDTRFRLLVDQLPFSLQIVDPSGRIVRVNRAWEKLWGVTLDELAGYNLLQDQQLIDKGIMPYILRAFSGEATEIPAVAYVPDRGEYQGQDRWTRSIIYPVLDENHDLREVVLIHEDVTARVQAEEKLRANEARQELLLRLLQGQRETSDPAAMMAAAAEAVGRHLRANRVGFFEMADDETLLFTTSWSDGVLEPLSGTFPADGIGTGYLAEVRAGRTLGFSDTSREPMTADSSFAEIGARAIIGAPIIRDGRWHAGFYVNHSEVRAWCDDDIALVREVADQTWDAVERARVQQALHEAQVRLETTLVASEIGTWFWDIVNDRVFADPNLARMYSVGPKDAAGGRIESYLQAVHPEDRMRMQSVVAEALHSPSGQYETDYRLVQNDNSVRWVTARGKVERNAEGQPMRLPGVVIDITERKRAEEHVAYQKRLLEALTESVLDAILIVSPEGKLIHVNKRFLDMWHFPPEILASKSDEAALRWAADQTSNPAEFLARVAAAYENPDSVVREEVALRDGRVYERFGSSIRAGEARLGWVWTFRDITERRQTELALERAKQEAEEANREKDRFLAMLSHELRTPLTPVLMTLGALRQDVNISDTLRADLELIQRNVELETLLINDLLDVTRIAHGKFELHRQAVDVHTAIDQALAISAADVQKKRLHVTKNFAAREHHTWADAARLQQVFWNIIKNAVKFTATGGGLRISTRNDAEHHVIIDFTDTGIGIEPDVQARIFEAFEQGGRWVTSQYGGLGLGLSISKRVIDMHDGRISVRSRGVDCGTTFSVALKAMETSLLEGPAPPPLKVRRPVRRSSILLVEDHADTARVLQRMLEHAGYRVAHASSIAAARELAAKLPVDLLISDVGLPDGSGLDLMRELRNDRALTGIALSGFGMQADLAASRAAGFIEHFTKPVDWERLRESIDRLVEQSGTGSGSPQH